jgi:hypothetical protein
LSAGQEALQVISDFVKGIPGWPGGRQSTFFWFYGARVKRVKGEAAALPYYAASMLANPSRESAAWTKFPGKTPSASEAKNLAQKYPLPEPFKQSSIRKWWQLRK